MYLVVFFPACGGKNTLISSSLKKRPFRTVLNGRFFI